MTPRHIALVVGSAVVFCTAVYLFVAVRAAPAQPPVSTARPTAPAAQVTPPVVAEADPPPVTPAPTPAPTPLEAGSDAGSEPPADTHGKTLEGLSPFKAGGKAGTLMDAANRAYDKGEYDEARQAAAKVLAQQPGNERCCESWCRPRVSKVIALTLRSITTCYLRETAARCELAVIATV